MREKITASQLKKALGGDFEELLQKVAQTINQAQPGHIIAESEEPVHAACARFRQRLYGKALQLRQQQNEPAFSPSGQRGGSDVGE